MNRSRHYPYLALAMLASSVEVFAQRNSTQGVQAFREATTIITNYFEPASNLALAIGAVVGIIGAVRVYNKWSSGDPDTMKAATAWFGACIFLLLSGAVIKAFFLS